MRLGIRGQLFTLSLLVMLGVGLPSGLYLEHHLRQQLEDRTELELLHLARAARDLIEAAPELERCDELTDRLGASTSVRVTVIAADGTVLGDSELDGDALRNVENHANRPEVRAARAGEYGTSRRFSTTVNMEMQYVAVPYRRPDGRGVARVSMALREVARSIGQLRLLLLLAGLLGLAVALLVAVVASHMSSRRLRQLVEHAREVAAASSHEPAPVASADEIDRLAGSFNKLARELDATVESLAAERDRLGTILESMNEGVLALDEDSVITLANRAAKELFGLSDSPQGLPLHDTVPVQALAKLVADAPEPGASVEFELPGTPPRGVLARAAPLRSQRGLVLVTHDVTEMRRLERIREDFVANVSHELRTPVSVISANAETLVEGAIDSPDLARGFLDAIQRNSHRMSQVIADLLDLSRIEVGHYPLELKPTAMYRVVRQAAEAVDTAACEKKLNVQLDVAEDIVAIADATALDHVFLNLLDNAVKYTPDGGSVVVRAEVEDDRVHIDVCDNGPGIEPKYHERIFERFYRVDKGRSRKMGGTGLGLSITKHLVDAMGGTVRVKANEEQGTVFRVSLERAEPAPRE